MITTRDLKVRDMKTALHDKNNKNNNKNMSNEGRSYYASTAKNKKQRVTFPQQWCIDLEMMTTEVLQTREDNFAWHDENNNNNNN